MKQERWSESSISRDERERGERKRESGREPVVKAQATEQHHRGLIKYGNYNC